MSRNLSRLPVYSPPVIFHVGHRPAVMCDRRPYSYEGPGLSVSECPEAWTRIARLGGHVTWRMRRADGASGRFVDVRAIPRRVRRAIEDAEIAAGWLHLAFAYTADSFDDECDSPSYSLHETADEALKESGVLGECEDEGIAFPSVPAAPSEVTRATPDHLIVRCGDLSVRRVVRVLPTPKLQAWWAQHFASPLSLLCASDMALARVVGESPLFDGLWWHDTMSPETLSAPRGVIVPRALGAWQSCAATSDELSDQLC